MIDSLNKYKINITIFIFVSMLFLAIYYIAGYIPVSGGAGWDGSVYLNYVQTLGAGGEISGDPYREIRMPGFLPIIIAAKLGALSGQIITIQAVLNALLLSFSACLLYSTLLNLGVRKHAALLSLGTLILTWPFLVMPIFYPILSDHAALSMSCICLWCWSRSLRWVLYVMCAVSLWIIPSLFIVPLILSSFPLRSNFQPNGPSQKIVVVIVAAIISACAITLLPEFLRSFPKDEILAHSAVLGGPTALIELRLLSSFSIAVGALLIIWIYTNITINSATWASINYKNATISIAAVIASMYYMYTSTNWTSGFIGPPLTHYMVLQSLALPFKPLVSHFASLTPTIILSLIIIVKHSLGKSTNTPTGLVLLFSAFLPFLLFGSESRQWIGVLPILVTIFAMSNYSFWQRIWCLLMSAALIAPVFWLHDKSIAALQAGVGLQAAEWQYYFGRQGPWMSVRSYEIGILALTLYFIVHVMLSKPQAISDNKNIENTYN